MDTKIKTQFIFPVTSILIGILLIFNTVSLDHLGDSTNNAKAKVLAEALDDATEKLLANRKGPSRKAGELDNRGSHFYLAMYWAEALSNQNTDANLRAQFSSISQSLNANESIIVSELNDVQGNPVAIGGYYEPNEALIKDVMRPSITLNSIIDKIA